MADVISRSLEQTNLEIKKLNSELKQTGLELSNVKKDIKLDSGNVDKVKQKFALLNQQIEQNTNKITLYKQKQQIFDDQLEKGIISQQKYIKNTQALNNQITKTEKHIADLTAQLSTQNKELATAKLDKFNNSLTTLENKAKSARRVVLLLTTAVVALVLKTVSLGDELSDTASKLNTTAEHLQLGRNIYEKLAGGASEYDAALKALATSMTSIAGGRGARYLSALQDLGVEYKELLKYDTSEQLEIITKALANVTDETQRTQLAMRLMNDAGRSVALIAAQDTAEIEKYNQELINTGLISNEEAAVADELANKFDAVKRAFGLASAKLVVALLPAIRTLVDLLNNAVIPIINAIAGVLDRMSPAGQKVLLIIVGIVIILPKLISIIKLLTGAVKLFGIGSATASGGVGALGAASTTLLPVIIAISLALLTIIILLAVFSKRAREAADSVSGITDNLTKMNVAGDLMSKDLDAETTAITESNTTKTINMNLDIYGHGDTDLSDDAAKAVAINFADVLQEQWGGLV